MKGLEMKYFVLKPKGDDAYAKASRVAMLRYSHSIREENQELSDELHEWAVSEFPDEELEAIGRLGGDDGQRR